MSKSDKKKQKLQDRINTLEEFLRTSLSKKDSAKTEVNVPAITREIAKLKAEQAAL